MAIVSVVIPTKNEHLNVVRVIGEVREASLNCNILIIDDSDDNRTRVLALASGARVIEGQRKGLGQAIIDGIKASEDDIVVVMDADGSHPCTKIPELVNACNNGYSMAIGSRYVKGGAIVGWTNKRRLISLAASILAYPITRLRDNTSGFFAVKKYSLYGVPLCADSWKIMLEVLIKTRAKAIEVPIEFRDRQAGKSNFTNKEAWRYLKHLFKLALWKWRWLNFMIVGGLGFIINMGIYYPLTLISKNDVSFLGQHFYLPPFVISSLVAITSNYYFNKVWTFGDRKAESLSYLRYLSMASATLLLDMFLLFIFVDYGGLMPVLAAALAIIIAFVLRYVISDKWIWRRLRGNAH